MKSTTAKKRKTNPEMVLRRRAGAKLVPFGIFLLAGALIALILFWNQPWRFEQQEFVQDEPAPRSFFSPVSFSYVDEAKTEVLRLEKQKNSPPVYRVDPVLTANIRQLAESFFIALQEIRSEKEKTGTLPQKELPIHLPSFSLESLLSAKDIAQVQTVTLSALNAYLLRGMVPELEKQGIMDSGRDTVLHVAEDPRQETVVLTTQLLTVEEAVRESFSVLPSEIFNQDAGLRTAAAEVLRGLLAANLVYDEEKTREHRKKLSAAVPPVEIRVKKNELIVQRGLLVTKDVKEKLDQVQKKISSRKQKIQIVAGSFIILLLYGLASFYFAAFETKIFHNRSQILLFHTVIGLTTILSRMVESFPQVSMYLMPTVLATLLLTLLIHSRIGILGGVMMTVISGFLSGFSVDLLLATLMASLATAFLAYRVRKRSHFLRIGLGIGCTYFLVIAGFQLTQSTPWRDALQLGFLGFLNALLIAVTSYLMLPVLEHFFDVVTDVTLLELSDLNHPLMRKMMVEAPGTYHHSLVVSSLAENACERIGANALLAKVGCYFHDIGKLEKPQFFTENQGYLYMNQHDDLPPRVSFEIIINHVRDGVRIARKYRLRRAVVDFIREHQGTGVVYYFFKKAMDMAAPSDRVRADDFRYPGPKPQTRETAVALLADSAEAATRSLQELTPETIRQLVRKIINDKFIDGQLDECELTLRDLHKIQSSFVRNMTAMFHTRMKYPTVDRPLSAPDIFGADQFSKFRADE